jgi:hypothetical protein
MVCCFFIFSLQYIHNVIPKREQNNAIETLENGGRLFFINYLFLFPFPNQISIRHSPAIEHRPSVWKATGLNSDLVIRYPECGGTT